MSLLPLWWWRCYLKDSQVRMHTSTKMNIFFTDYGVAHKNKFLMCVCVHAVPHSPFGDDRLTGCTVGKALFVSMVFMTVLGCIVLLVTWLKRKHKCMKGPLERGCVAQGKHPNVVRSLTATVNRQLTN